jgi:sigma-B regulation protein RsbU (phosphoserine phosphatase)
LNERDLELAAKVHYSFLQKSFSNDSIDIAVKCMPFDRIGGDYSSIMPLDDTKLTVCMCDAVGHGIASAFLAVRVNTFVLSYMRQNHDPCGLIHALNSYLFACLTGTAMYSTFAIVLFDFTGKSLFFVGASHPPLLHFIAATGEVEFMNSEAIFLGVIDPLSSGCPGTSKDIASNDRVFLCTDGVIETKNEEGQNFGSERLSDFARANSALSNDEFNAALCNELADFSGGSYTDDILTMSITVK